jgi:hypothetical protein
VVTPSFVTDETMSVPLFLVTLNPAALSAGRLMLVAVTRHTLPAMSVTSTIPAVDPEG